MCYRAAPFAFGCTQLKVPPAHLVKLQNNINMSPCGVAFVKGAIRRGVLPRMLQEILDTRLMVIVFIVCLLIIIISHRCVFQTAVDEYFKFFCFIFHALFTFYASSCHRLSTLILPIFSSLLDIYQYLAKSCSALPHRSFLVPINFLVLSCPLFLSHETTVIIPFLIFHEYSSRCFISIISLLPSLLFVVVYLLALYVNTGLLFALELVVLCCSGISVFQMSVI